MTESEKQEAIKHAAVLGVAATMGAMARSSPPPTAVTNAIGVTSQVGSAFGSTLATTGSVAGAIGAGATAMGGAVAATATAVAAVALPVAAVVAVGFGIYKLIQAFND